MKTIYKVLNIFMVLSLLFGMWPVTGVIAQGPDEPITPEVTEEAPLVDSDGSLVTDFDDVVIDASDETLQPAESTASPDGEITPQDAETKIAVISDFGVAISDPHKAAIATLITNWAPVAVVTGGDNYHDRTPLCSSYAECLAGYNSYTAGYTDFVTSGMFFPSYGNHDAMHSAAYTSYFSYLPSTPSSSHLYYDVKVGNVHFWVLNGNVNLASSGQEAWLAANAPDETVAWNIAVVHQSPYSTGTYGDTADTQIPYQDYGIDYVLSGHNHIYERLQKDGVRYILAGRAGDTNDTRSCTGTGSAATSEYCASINGSDSYGYIQLVATETAISFTFIAENGTILNSYSSDDPDITVTPGSLSFTSQPGVPSEVKNYTVSGTGLLGDVVITPPADFEISLSSGSGFSASPINLTPTDGVLADVLI